MEGLLSMGPTPSSLRSGEGVTSLPLLQSGLFLARYIISEATSAIFPSVLLSVFTFLIPHILATMARTVWFLAVITPLAPTSKGVL